MRAYELVPLIAASVYVLVAMLIDHRRAAGTNKTRTRQGLRDIEKDT